MVRSGSVGDYAVVDYDVDNAIFGSYLIKFNIDNSKVLNKYFCYFYESQAFKKQLNKIIQASANTNINADNIKSVHIHYPHLLEQQKIVNFISLIDEKILTQKKIIEDLKMLKNSINRKILMVTCNIKKNIKITDLCNITTGKLDANAMVPDGEYRFYTCAEKYYFIDKYAFDTEALLISGNGANVGYIHYYNGKFNAYQRTYVLSNFKCNPLFLKIYLDYFLPKRIETTKHGGNTPYIKMETISDLDVKLPNEGFQEKIVSLNLKFDANIINEKRILELYQKQKDYLLNKMFI